jgi:predicted P-loop ATPase
MVAVGNSLDIEWVTENRDQIWGAAKTLYQRGTPWWFDRATEQVVMARAEDFRQKHPWEEILSEVLPALKGDMSDAELETLSPSIREMLFGFDKSERLTTNAILQILGVTPDRQGRAASNQLAAVMRSLGWDFKVVKRNGIQQKEWRPNAS